MPRPLRSGFSTGACAAAASKAAVVGLLTGTCPASVQIPFPDGSRASFDVVQSEIHEAGEHAVASVIKDAGDDPDVTNGAEISAQATWLSRIPEQLVGMNDPAKIDIRGGEGVGTVTKPGLAVAVGEPAINPVPRRMIREAVLEALKEWGQPPPFPALAITISVPRGVELAKKTLNARLGIVGGLSILGTTGIVRPVSADAWTATIRASMDVARAAGLREIVLSTGRTSERAAMSELHLPDEAFAMMGDYLEYALREASAHGFERIHVSAMWAKLVKAAAGWQQTHVRHGALEVEQILDLLTSLGASPEAIEALQGSNTGREIFDRLEEMGRRDLIRRLCEAARSSIEKLSGGVPVTVYLVHPSGRIIERV